MQWLPQARGVYSFANKDWEGRVVLPSGGDKEANAAGEALAAWRVLGCRDAGQVDLRSDARKRTSSVNPGGLRPGYSTFHPLRAPSIPAD